MKKQNNYNKPNYKAWLILEKDFPYSKDIAEQLKFIVGFGVLAPSTFNAQPWKCRIKKNIIEVYLDSSRVLKKSDKTGRFAYVSLGCFIQNILIASENYGLTGNVLHKSGSMHGHDLIAIITFKKSSRSSGIKAFFYAITERATNRSISLRKKIPLSIIRTLENSVKIDQQINILEQDMREVLLRISKKADLAIWGDGSFRKEHVIWVRNNLTRQYDGMPAFGVGIGLLPSFFAKPIILSPLFAIIQAKKNCGSLASSQYYVVINAKDNKTSWINVGLLYQYISLYLASNGIAVSPMGQFIENDSARNELAQVIKVRDLLRPQLFFRIGYPSLPVKHSPRIPVEKILI